MNRAFFARVFAKSLLLSTFFVPLIVTRFSLYPFVYGKALFLYGIVEVAFFCYLISVILEPQKSLAELREKWNTINQKLLLCLLMYVFFVVLSTFFAVATEVSFWGIAERSDGLFMQLHLVAFILLSSILFERKDWGLYLKGLVACTGLIVFVVAIKQDPQPLAFFGNPAYLSSFLVSFLYFAALIVSPSIVRKYRILISIGVICILSTILLTGIRAATLGIVGGVFVGLFIFLFTSTQKKHQFIAGGVLACIFLFSGIFIATRHASIWQHIPTVKRLATLKLDSASLVQRTDAWRAGFESFKERPLFGVGGDNYGMIFEKYGTTQLSCYKDGWYTSLHNKWIDVLAGNGIFALLSYLFLLIVLFYEHRKNTLFIVFFTAYIFQSLFLFDTVSTSVIFAAAIGFTLMQRETSLHAISQKCSPGLLKIISQVLVLILSVVFFIGVWKPLRQQIQFGKFITIPNGDALIPLMEPLLQSTSAQFQLRPRVVTILREWGVAAQPQGRNLLAQATAALEETISKNPHDVRPYNDLILSYLELGDYDPQYLVKAEIYARKGIEYAPRTVRMKLLLVRVLSREKKI